jgi:hypothetical protein
MKHILVPIRVYETGDKVTTLSGNHPATVVHDEMEDFELEHASTLSCSLNPEGMERVIKDAQMRSGVTILIGLSHEIVTSRDSLTPFFGDL